MTGIDRRSVLRAAALGVAAAALGACGVRPGPPAPDGSAGAARSTEPGADLRQPPVLRSAAGVLAVDLVAGAATVDLAGRRVAALGYNGSLPGATWHVRPGDRLRVRLTNTLSRATNLHTHGLAVSPRDNGDNPFLAIAPGETFEYDIRIPADHPPGVCWYHPHHHGTVADQVFGGLYGAIVVAGDDEEKVDRERVLVVSDISVTTGGQVARVSPAERMMGREGAMVLVNGQVRPVLRASGGERERWRVVNACVSRFVDLRLPGHDLTVLGYDAGRLPEPSPVDRVLLPAGGRVDLLVDVRGGAGTSELVAEPYDRGTAGMMMGRGGRAPSSAERVVLATLVTEGVGGGAARSAPTRRAVRDLRGQSVSASREVVLAMGMGRGMGGAGMMSFTLDGREFDASRVDQDVPAGAVEEWELRNTSPMDHPFHLHVWPMQVVHEGGIEPAQPTWRDVVNVPANGTSLVRIAFDGVDGRTVYHCHTLDHEDLGMMAVIEVG
jgi:FtsP/CotA-like multicopper oxidase with cupredoxin domain